jgi:hypothetical protein
MSKYKIYKVINEKAELLGEKLYTNELSYLPEYSTFYDYDIVDDIVNLSDTLKINFKFYSGFDDIKIVFGEIDKDFNLISSKIHDTIKVLNHSFNYKVLPRKYGVNSIEGVVIGSHNIKVKHVRKMPIYIDYYVVSSSKVDDTLRAFFSPAHTREGL